MSQTDLQHQGRFGGFIGPVNLMGLVRVAAPFLFEGDAIAGAEAVAPDLPLHAAAGGELGWLSVLASANRLEGREAPDGSAVVDYFALCVSSHFATAGTYVPTDVDAKIRHALWFDQKDREGFRRMVQVALGLADWNVSKVNARFVALEPEWGLGPEVSGHDGERLSVWVGGLVAASAKGVRDLAEELEATVMAELRREAAAFERLSRTRGRELDTVRAAGIVTHNVGDVNQALEAGKAGRIRVGCREKITKLAQDGPERFGGAFARAAAIYRALLSAEGHRNYPLRGPRCLRRSPELLLQVSPFLDDWGRLISTTRLLSDEERLEVVGALAEGCTKVAGQEAYYRALAGLDQELPGGLFSKSVTKRLRTAGRKALMSAELRRKVATARRSFESSYVTRAAKLL